METIPTTKRTRILRKAMLARAAEERLLGLFAEGKLSGTLHTCIGQELCGAAVSEALRPGDTVFSNHRGHGHFLARTGDVQGLLAELLGRVDGVCGGWGGSQHLCRDGFFSNGLQGGIVPAAAGLAWAAQRRGRGELSVVFMGDGTLGEGAVYEAWNIAARWSLPLLVVLEDNGIAQSTPSTETFAGDVEARARGFGLGYTAGDTWDWEALGERAEQAANAARAGQPQLLHVRTFRLKAHSKGDDTRNLEVVTEAAARDPLNRWLATDEGMAGEREARDKVAEAEIAALASPVAGYRRPEGEAPPSGWKVAPAVPAEKMVKALNATLRGAFQRDPELLMLGEDIESPYGGAFKVTAGLSQEFPGRVRNTPISESAIVGLAAGAALRGGRVLAEIMFGDFLGLAFDQLVNHAAKFERMFAGQVRCGVVVRTPMGGRRGYGPTHSQTLDAHFLGAPGLRVLALHGLLGPDELYRPLLGAPAGATLVIENKIMYGQPLLARTPAGFSRWVSEERFPVTWLRPEGARADITLIGYGGMAPLLVEAAERLFDEHERIAQILVPMQLHPFDVRPWLPVLDSADALLIAEEGNGFAGFGAELLGQLAEHGGGKARRVARVTAPNDLIPASAAMEKAVLPGVDTIIARARALCV
jgi:2-oxoisovalerate dehydrogenase E1 component